MYIPIIRYAEILLINAEAKAELGILTQNDLNATVNLLRSRVEMPEMTINVPIDPALEALYPSVSGALKNVILEIRRERRVELACEGFRYDDTMRWAAGSIYERPFEGVYLPGFGVYDCTGDGVPDVALFKSPNDKMGYTDEELKELSVYYTEDENGVSKTDLFKVKVIREIFASILIQMRMPINLLHLNIIIIHCQR